MSSSSAYGGVYTITNLLTGQQYIGSSEHIIKRWHSHLAALKNNNHGCLGMQESWNKHGSQCFAFSIVALIDGYQQREEHEMQLIKASNPRKLYNVQGVFLHAGVGKEDICIYCPCGEFLFWANDCDECNRTFREIVRKNPVYQKIARRLTPKK